MARPRALWVALAAVLWIGLVTAPARAEAPRPVVIGSKMFTESRLLAEIMAQLIERRTGLAVERRIGLGGTKIVFGALRDGQIDLYPEYTGTGWTVMLKRADRVRDSLRAYLAVKRAFRKEWQLEWLAPFGFNNSYAMAMNGPKARELGLERVSDLVAHQDALRAGVSHEFLERPDGYPGLSKAYGLQLGDVKGMEHGLAYEALRTGKTDLIDTYTTDGKLLRYDVAILDDDRRFFPPYDAAPLVRVDLLDRHPQLRGLLEELAFTIDDEAMRKLNYAVEEGGGTFEGVATRFLQSEGLLEAAAAQPKVRPASPGLLSFLWQSKGDLLQRVGEHLMLTLVAVLLAIAVAVPLGIALVRRERLAATVLGGTGVIQTVPSLALLAFMLPIPGLGLGVRSAIAALFLYALLPIVRNTYTGIAQVDPDLIEAAQGMGLTRRQILLHVQLPTATSTIMAGIRTSTVISIGVATLAAFIGAGGLGDPIVTGLQLDNLNMILSGAIPAALLALLVDGLLGRLEHWLVPRGLRAVEP